ncbi:MAG: hypothetical protein ACFFCW_38640 [Candidatus Hodarchaeota archaeon]
MHRDTNAEFINRKANHINEESTLVSIRRIPYPYRAMLAICSDLDETPDQQMYFETIKYLNTTETTIMGPGVGLETGNTIYFDMPHGQFSYWNTDDKGRAVIRTLIQSGHIDCLHSYGDLAPTRAHAKRALAELSRHNCSLEVWIDHGIAPTNFGPDIMQGQGDVKGSKAYHADITTDFGVKYVWRGRVTSIIGQNAPRRLRGIWSPQHPKISCLTVLKELAKGVYAFCGNTKYAMHGPNQIMREIRLRSGQKVFEFMRSNTHWGGISYGDNADGLTETLRNEVLSRLVNRDAVSIIYTHLGKFKRNCKPFYSSTKQALSLLSQYSREGKILVTTTNRILRYCKAIRDIKLSASTNDNHYTVNITISVENQDLNGLSIYVPDQKKTKVLLNGYEVKNITRNSPDHTGRPSISLPWQLLEFPRV